MKKPTFRRKLGLTEGVAICIGSIFGADIYIVTSQGAQWLGPASLIAWAVSGIAAVFMAMCLAECSGLFPKAGGPYIFETAAFGMFAGAILGWALWIAEWAAIATFPISFTQYLGYVFPDVSSSFPLECLVKILFIGSIMAVQYTGTKEVGIFHTIFTVEKMILVAFILLLIPMFSFSNLHDFAPKGYDALGIATTRIFWAYMGFELVTMPAEEFRNPRKDVHRSIIIGIILIMVIYMVTNIILFGSVGWQKIALTTTPIADAAQIALGSTAGVVLAVAGLMSIMNSETGTFLGTTRLAYAMGKDGILPRAFANIHPKRRIPHIAILIQGLAAMAASCLFNIYQLILFSSFTVLIAYASICVATILFRVRMPNLERPYKVPIQLRVRGKEIPVPAVIGALAGVAILIHTSREEVLGGLFALAIGVTIYLLVIRREGISFSWRGIELMTLRTLEFEGGWMKPELIASKVYESAVTTDKQLNEVKRCLKVLGDRDLVFVRDGVEWRYKPRLKPYQKALLQAMKDREFRPTRIQHVQRYLDEKGLDSRFKKIYRVADRLREVGIIRIGKFGRYELALEREYVEELLAQPVAYA